MTKFIADIGSNHNQDFERCKVLIGEAKRVGCWAVKFQLFDHKTLYRNPTKEQLENLKRSELPIEFLPEIYNVCKNLDIKFGCTPFYEEAVNILEPFVDFYKISSFDIEREDLIEKCKSTGKFIVMSNGMGPNHKLWDTSYKGGLAVLSCISKYPAKVEDCGLLKDEIQNTKGWSDHTKEPGVIYAAVAHEAKYIEFHLDLSDGMGREYDHGHCWIPAEIYPVIETCKVITKSLYRAGPKPIDKSLLSNSKDGMRG